MYEASGECLIAIPSLLYQGHLAAVFPVFLVPIDKQEPCAHILDWTVIEQRSEPGKMRGPGRLSTLGKDC